MLRGARKILGLPPDGVLPRFGARKIRHAKLAGRETRAFDLPGLRRFFRSFLLRTLESGPLFVGSFPRSHGFT